MRTYLLFVLLACLVGGACVVDDYYADELTVTLDGSLDALIVDEGYTIEGNQMTIVLCALPAPEWVYEAEFTGPGPHELEVVTESEEQRAKVALRAWHDADGDGEAGCDEPGVRAVVDLAETREITLPLPDEPPEPGGAGCDGGGDDDSAR